MLDKIGMCFMFAPKYHSSMKYASPVRRELGIRTVFNILGPLANPANANRQLIDGSLSRRISRAISESII